MSNDTNPTNVPTADLLAYQRQVNYDAIVADFGPSVTLVYADYRDQFDARSLNALLHGDYESVDEGLDEWAAEAQFYGVQAYLDNLPSELREAVDEDDELREMAIEYLWEHDESTWWADMLRNSDRQLLLYRIGEDAHEAEGIIDAMRSVGLDPDANADVVDELLANNGHYGGTVYIMWYGDVADLIEANDGKARTITWTNPRILAYCHMNGAGWEAEAHGTASITYDAEAIHIDGCGPSYSVDGCFGFYLPAISNDPVLALDVKPEG